MQIIVYQLKDQCIKLDLNGETAENVGKVKYLGDTFNRKGNNNDLIESRVKTGKQTIGVIQAFCKEIALGNYEIHIMLQLYESIFLSTVLFNCQSWTNVTNTHIESLQTLQMKYLKQPMWVPYQGWTGMYTLVVPSSSTKFIKNSQQNLPV